MNDIEGFGSPRSILAVVYADGFAADRLLAAFGYRLRDNGLAVAGLVQRNLFVRDRIKCDMEVEELASGAVLQLSEDRGPGARGCRLDRGALSEAAALLMRALDRKLDVLVLNKFGKVEAEGRGLRDAIAAAAALGVPMLVGVPFRNLDQWRAFAGDLAEECSSDRAPIERWLSRQGISALGARRPAAAEARSKLRRPARRETDTPIKDKAILP